MEIEILHLLEGAKRARGTAVIIDVFRAFTVESTAMAMGAKRIYPVKTVEEARALKRREPDALLAGERGGYRLEGFDCNNSPTELRRFDLTGRTVIHTTSAGTQGLAAATYAEELLGGALVNARATADYIRKKSPEHVSLVAMGLGGESIAEEDELCAEYIRSLLMGEPMALEERIAHLKETTGKKFFDPKLQEPFPETDFMYSTQVDRFDFALRIERGGSTNEAETLHRFTVSCVRA